MSYSISHKISEYKYCSAKYLEYVHNIIISYILTYIGTIEYAEIETEIYSRLCKLLIINFAIFRDPI